MEEAAASVRVGGAWEVLPARRLALLSGRGEQPWHRVARQSRDLMLAKECYVEPEAVRRVVMGATGLGTADCSTTVGEAEQHSSPQHSSALDAAAHGRRAARGRRPVGAEMQSARRSRGEVTAGEMLAVAYRVAIAAEVAVGDAISPAEEHMRSPPHSSRARGRNRRRPRRLAASAHAATETRRASPRSHRRRCDCAVGGATCAVGRLCPRATATDRLHGERRGPISDERAHISTSELTSASELTSPTSELTSPTSGSPLRRIHGDAR